MNKPNNTPPATGRRTNCDPKPGPKSIFLYGPPGSGKTRNAHRIAIHFGLQHWRDGWAPGDRIPTTNHLIITNVAAPHFARRAITITRALALVENKQPLTTEIFDLDAPHIPRDSQNSAHRCTHAKR